MFKRRNPTAHLGHAVEIDIRINNPGVGAAVGENFAPGVDNQRMAVGIALIGMVPALVRRDDIGAGFDRARAKAYASAPYRWSQ